MSRALADLSPRFRPLAVQLLAKTVEAGIPVLIVDTLRTPAEHAVNLARGVSWIKHSKHIDGDAIDICPYAIWEAHGNKKLNWDPTDPVWKRLGLLGEAIRGVGWGGRWRIPDLGHFEYVAAPPEVRV